MSPALAVGLVLLRVRGELWYPRGMPIRTYALVDVIGVKEALRRNDTRPLREFWATTDAWTNAGAGALGPLPLLGQHAEQVPNVSVVTFSDSALLFTSPEHELAAFYRILGSLKGRLEATVGHVYCIVSRGDEIAHHEIPALGGNLIGTDNRPNYFNVAGSGAAWVNLHLADKAIGKHREWHAQYSLYCVGAASKPPGVDARDQITFRSFDDNDQLVLALA